MAGDVTSGHASEHRTDRRDAAYRQNGVSTFAFYSVLALSYGMMPVWTIMCEHLFCSALIG